MVVMENYGLFDWIIYMDLDIGFRF